MQNKIPRRIFLRNPVSHFKQIFHLFSFCFLKKITFLSLRCKKVYFRCLKFKLKQFLVHKKKFLYFLQLNFPNTEIKEKKETDWNLQSFLYFSDS